MSCKKNSINAIVILLMMWLGVSTATQNAAFANSSSEAAARSTEIEEIYQQGRALIPEDLDGAIAIFEGLLTDSAEDLTDRWFAEVHFGLGLAYYHKTFYNLAETHFTQALATDHAQNDVGMRLNLYNNLGVVNDLSRQYDAAIGNYLRALTIAQNRNQPADIAEIHNNISLIYYNLDQWEDALDELELAQALIANLDVPLLQGLIYQNQAINHYSLERFDDYYAANRQALDVYQSIGAHTQELQVLFNLSEDAFRRTGDMDAARRLIDQATEKAQSEDVGVMQAYFLIQAGKLALIEGKPSDAIYRLNQAAARFESLGFETRSLPDDLYLNLIEAYAREGEVDQMLSTLAEFREAELAREMAAQRASVNELRTQLRFNEQENRLQKQTIELQAQRSRNVRLLFVLLLLLILSVAGVAYHRLRINSLQRLYTLNQQAITRQRQRAEVVESSDPQPTHEADDTADVDVALGSDNKRGQLWVYRRIEKVMRDDQLYRHSGLTVPDLADQLNLSKRLVSEAVNSFAGGTFPEYLNQLRITHAMERLDDQASDHISIDQILDEAGFSSRSAFYAAFKKACGMTPREYRKASRRNQAVKRSS